jgi:hypothetical protein
VSVKKEILSERSELISFSEGSKFLAKFHGRSLFCYFASRQSRKKFEIWRLPNLMFPTSGNTNLR